jgi:hypothetical protein
MQLLMATNDAIEVEARSPVAITAIVAAALVAVALSVSAAWVGRERARQSTECVKAGGEWIEAECRRKP